MTETERVELAAVAVTYGVFGMNQVVPLRSKWDELSAADSYQARLRREQASQFLADARAAKRSGVCTSWDWLLNA